LFIRKEQIGMPKLQCDWKSYRKYSADAKSVSVVYRVTLYGTDAEVPTYHFTIYKEIHYSIVYISCTKDLYN